MYLVSLVSPVTAGRRLAVARGVRDEVARRCGRGRAGSAITAEPPGSTSMSTVARRGSARDARPATGAAGGAAADRSERAARRAATGRAAARSGAGSGRPAPRRVCSSWRRTTSRVSVSRSLAERRQRSRRPRSSAVRSSCDATATKLSFSSSSGDHLVVDTRPLDRDREPVPRRAAAAPSRRASKKPRGQGPDVEHARDAVRTARGTPSRRLDALDSEQVD